MIRDIYLIQLRCSNKGEESGEACGTHWWEDKYVEGLGGKACKEETTLEAEGEVGG
jgi:hypothetical protein